MEQARAHPRAFSLLEARMIRLVALALLITPAAAAEQWRLDPDGKWVSVDPRDGGQWRHAPTGHDGWQWVRPDQDWRLDPNGHWQVVPVR
jgi:hypothetical protein